MERSRTFWGEPTSHFHSTLIQPLLYLQGLQNVTAAAGWTKAPFSVESRFPSAPLWPRPAWLEHAIWPAQDSLPEQNSPRTPLWHPELVQWDEHFLFSTGVSAERQLWLAFVSPLFTYRRVLWNCSSHNYCSRGLRWLVPHPQLCSGMGWSKVTEVMRGHFYQSATSGIPSQESFPDFYVISIQSLESSHPLLLCKLTK